MTGKEIIERQQASGNQQLYLMQVGLFYQAYEAAALVLSELTGYRVIERRRKGDVIIRCLGFPSKQLPHVRERLREKGIELVAEEAPPDLPQGEELVEGFRLKDEGNLYVFTVPEGMSIPEPPYRPFTPPTQSANSLSEAVTPVNSLEKMKECKNEKTENAQQSTLNSQLERELLSFNIADHTPVDCLLFILEWQRRLRV